MDQHKVHKIIFVVNNLLYKIYVHYIIIKISSGIESDFTILNFNLCTAPEDYATLVTTLTFQQGTDGSLRRARDAACVSVFIFDDDLPEDTESFSFHIRSPDTSSVRIMEGYEQTTIHIIDNDGRLDVRVFSNCIYYIQCTCMHTPHTHINTQCHNNAHIQTHSQHKCIHIQTSTHDAHIQTQTHTYNRNTHIHTHKHIYMHTHSHSIKC